MDNFLTVIKSSALWIEKELWMLKKKYQEWRVKYTMDDIAALKEMKTAVERTSMGRVPKASLKCKRIEHRRFATPQKRWKDSL